MVCFRTQTDCARTQELDLRQKKAYFSHIPWQNSLPVQKIVVPLHRQKETKTSSIETQT